MDFTSSCISLLQVLSHRPLLQLAYSDQLILFAHHLYYTERSDQVPVSPYISQHYTQKYYYESGQTVIFSNGTTLC
jgi:hypothetical protein